MKRFTLRDFVRESNRIEGIRHVTLADMDAHACLMACHVVTLDDLQRFVQTVAKGQLREHAGMDVSVGQYVAPPGGADIRVTLQGVLSGALACRGNHSDAYIRHHMYETLHPFTDGNGRSGRALWLWQVGGIERAPLGFLHHFYYQALSARIP